MEDALQIIGGVIVIVGFLFGVYQYYVAQRWKKAEFAANQLLKLSSNPDLELCCRILDWAQRPFLIPERYHALTGQTVLNHTWQELAQAMKPETINPTFTGQPALYRELFDEFFTYLSDIDHFISIGLINLKDVSSLRYWLEQIANPRFTPEPIFKHYIEFYQYNGVIDLMGRFGIRFR